MVSEKRLENKVDVEALCDAAATGDDAKVKEIIDNGGVDINEAWNITEDDYDFGNFHDEWYTYKRNALHYAMQFNYPFIVDLLLNCERTKLDMVDGDGRSALQLGCMYNALDCVKLFLKSSGCTPDIVNMKSKDGDTALTTAAKCGNVGCVWEIVQFSGADFGGNVSNEEKLMELAREGGDIDAAIAEEENELKLNLAIMEKNYKKAVAELNEKFDKKMEEMEQKRESKGEELKECLL